MSDLKLNVSDETLRELMGKTLLGAIDQASRDALIANAIKHLLEEKRDSYGGRPVSPLMLAFKRAIEDMADSIVRQQIASDGPLRAQIEQLVSEATARVFAGENRERLVESMAKNITTALTQDVKDRQ